MHLFYIFKVMAHYGMCRESLILLKREKDEVTIGCLGFCISFRVYDSIVHILFFVRACLKIVLCKLPFT